MSDIIRVPFGYLLQWLYEFVGNYGLALIFFALILKLILLPLSMKSKKSMMKIARVSPKMKALELKYGEDKTKYQQEVMKLYKEERINPTGGCLWSFIPLLLLIPLYQVVRQPIVYIMHLDAGLAQQITEFIGGMVDLGPRTYYHEMMAASYIGQYLDQLKAAIPALKDVTLNLLNFNFLGMNMSAIPTFKFWTLTDWTSIGLFLIPVVSAASNYLSMWASQRLNGTVATNEKGEKDTSAVDAMGSTNKVMMLTMPLVSLYIGYQMPAAISIYGLAQAVFGVIQEFVLTNHYRKIYDAEDAEKQRLAAEEARLEAERERIREQRRAQNPEGVFNPNTSKKKLKAQERASQGPAIEGKLTPEQRAMLKQTGSLEQDQEQLGQDEAPDLTEHRAFSGDPERPFCRGRNYKPTRYGRKIDELEDK